MRVVFALTVAFVLAGRAGAEAQPAKDCGLYVEIKGGKITNVKSDARTSCHHNGRLVLLIQNLDNARYTLALDKFRFNTASAGVCSTSAAEGKTPLDKGDKLYHTFNIKEYEVDLRRKPIKAKGAHAAECYKFDISLRDTNDTETDRIDPELEITEPPPLPPVVGPKPPVKPPVKPPGA